MNRQDALHLLGERSTLQRMIADTPEEEVLDRGSLIARLEEVEYQIAQEQSRSATDGHAIYCLETRDWTAGA